MLRRVGITLGMLLFLSSNLVSAKRPMGIIDLFGTKTIANPRISADGSSVLFTMSEPDWNQNKNITHIYIADTMSGAYRQMTNGRDSEEQPAWKPDGTRFAFLSGRNNKENQIFMQDPAGGEAIQFTHHEGAVKQFKWSADGKLIYFIASDPLPADLKKATDEKDDAYSFEHNYQQQHLWQMDVSTGTEKRLTDGNFSVTSFGVSIDGTRFAYSAAPSPILEDSYNTEVFALDGRTGTRRQLTNNEVVESNVAIAPDGSTISFVCGCNADYKNYYTDRIFVAPFDAGAPRPLLKNFQYDVGRTAWVSSKEIYFSANMGVHTEIFSVTSPEGVTRMLTDGKKANTVASFDINATTGNMAFILADPSRPGEIYAANRNRFTPKQVTTIYDKMVEEFDLPRTEVVMWKGADGHEIEGLLTYPLNYRPGMKVPLVSQIHGGPQGSDQLSFGGWNSYLQVLAAKGYAILRPNYRGSTGYGDDYMRDMVGHYYNNADKDVMSGIDSLIAEGIADPDKLVIMGWSAGGHMTDWLVTHTDRFKAASAGAGASDWISMYAQSDHREFRTPWFGASPWVKDAPLDVYLNHSPIKYISQAKTPTLLLVGDKDPRVPMPQSVEMYRGLKANGVPTDLIIFPREPHGLVELRHRLTKVNKELEWFEKYVFGKAYEPERYPVSKPGSNN
jgi:dipeptidyl aminopeptidase/acylaminoacyl peptidase